VPEFDWYQATVRVPVNDVLEALHELTDRPSMRHGKGVQGYGTTTTIEDHSGPLVRVWHGGTHEHPHVVFSGETTPDGVKVFRSAFPDHSVSRVDVREDYPGASTFDFLQAHLLAIAADRRLKVGTAGDHLLTKEGRTTYIGSTASAVRVRLYDKAAELRSKFDSDPVKLAQLPDHLTRFEAQIKPSDPLIRRGFAQVDPAAMMGSSAWLREAWEKVSGSQVEPVRVTKPWRQSDDDRAYAFLLSQYGPVLRRMCQDLGSWECVGLQIGHDLSERDKVGAH
jgi:hypothetical protein